MPRRLLPVCLLLAAVTLAVFWPVTGHDFVNYDDNLYVTDNTHVREGLTLEGIWWAFGSLHACNWHPVTWLSHMLDVTLFGMRPGAHHLMNVLFHSANTGLLFAWLWRMTGVRWRSAMVAALFALHPLHVESVAWVAERKDMLSTFFGFLSLFCYAGYVQKRSKIEGRESKANATPIPGSRSGTLDYVLAFLFLAVGLMCKPMLVTWPFLMLLLDYWPLRRFEPAIPKANESQAGTRLSTGWTLVREKTPFLFLSLASSVITVIAQANGRAVMSLKQLPFDERLGNALISYARYLGKTFWPVNLAVPYPFPDYWPTLTVISSSLLVVSLCVGTFRLRRRWPFLPVGWFLFLGLLVPVIGILQVGAQSLADRYTYVPLVGIFIIAVWGGNEILTRWRLPQTIGVLVVGLVLAGCVMFTRTQLGYWQNGETLLRHSIAVTKDNAFACYDLGWYLEGKGRVSAAMEYYQSAVRISPRYTKALNNIGSILADKGHLDEAIKYYNRALQFDPNHLSTLYNLGIALADKRQFTEAMAMYEKVLRLDSNSVPARYNLGVALEAEGRWEEAVGQYTEALRLKPNYWQAHNNLGYLLMLHGRRDEAVPHFLESLRLNPKQPDAHFNLGNALAIQQKYEEAAMHFAECLKLSPSFAPAHKNLGMALARLGRHEEAVSHLQEAIRLKPDDEEAIQQLRALGAQKEE
ncbi:MAG: tetratricopeptide repeat protein [Verrucomicrobiota bacterium]|jgi:tetratricopeptide (TPR) repeat protein